MSVEQLDDYLWHAEGEADAFVRRLESLLERYRFAPAAPPEPGSEGDEDAVVRSDS